MADLVKATIGIEFKGQAGINQAAAAIGKTEASLKKLTPASGEATQSLVNLSRVAQDAPYGFIGIANNINPLLESFQRLKASTGTTGGALKALGKELTGAGGIGLAVGVVSSLLVVFGDKLFGASKKAKESADELERVKKVIGEVSRSFSEVKITGGADVADEIAKVNILSNVVKDQTKSYKERNNALEQLKSINKNYFGDLTLESNSLASLTSRVNEYTNALIAAAVVKEFSSDIAKVTVEASKQLNAYNQLSDQLAKYNNELAKTPKTERVLRGSAGGGSYVTETNKAYTELQGKIKDTNKALSEQGKVLFDLSNASRVSREGLQRAIEESLKFKPLTANGGTVNVNPDKVNFKPFEGKIFSGDIEIIPPEEAKNQGLTFAEMFGKEVKDYFTKNDPTDFSLINANKQYKIPVKYDFMGFKGLSETENDLAKIGEQIANTITPAFDAMVNAIGRGENAFKAFGDGVKQILIGVISKLVQTAILAATLSALFPGGLGGAKGFGSIFSKLLGFGGARASGGPVGVGRTYLVGEKGPELFTPGVSGNIVPNHRLGNLGGSFGSMQVSGVLVGRGNDLVAVINAAGRSNGRLV